MADIKNIEVDGTVYNIKDETARNNIGDMSGLQTTAKGSLVAAINEAAASGGGGTGLPSGGTAGQVLTMGSDGTPVWADATGGAAVPSAEGVEF